MVNIIFSSALAQTVESVQPAQGDSINMLKDTLTIAGIGLFGVFGVLFLFYITIKLMQIKKNEDK